MLGAAIAATALPLLPGHAAAGPGGKSLLSPRLGERPGPSILYRKPATAPQLRNRKPFRVRPLLVSASDAYRRGEYTYQDYLFDDYGADTVPGRGSRNPDPSADIAANTAGDVQYPTAPRYAGNAADIVELRIKPTRRSIFYRVTLNTANAQDAAVVGIGIDTDRSGGGQVEWPRGAGVTSAGLDRFITAWGSGGEVARRGGGEWRSASLPSGAVRMDLHRNQMTIRVPRWLLDPGRARWRHVAGAGLWDGDGWMEVPASRSASASEPASGSALRDAPGVFNLAFRFDEPQMFPPEPPYNTFPGVGNWFEDEQSRVLANGRTSGFFADVDFGKLADRAQERIHRPGRTMARILSSRLEVPDGRHDSFPGFGGRLQPYLIHVPPAYHRARARGRRLGLTLAMHSLGATYTQYAVFSPNQLRQLGTERANIVVTPLARGTNGWYTDEGEADVFEVWADVAHRLRLDPKRTYPSGYSMGGYGTYRLATFYPDLFARAFTVVGPPGNGIWIPPAPPTGGEWTNSNQLLENARWVPFMNWAELADQLVPYVGPRAQQDRFDSLGLRSQLWTFSPGEHFTLAVLDRWDAARDFLGRARLVRNPSRVNYAFMPDADVERLGLVHDHAYWVSGLRAREEDGDPQTDPARGEIDAKSLAFGEGEPPTHRVAAAQPGPPAPSTVDGTDWGRIPKEPRRNALRVKLENVGRAKIWGWRAKLDGRKRLRVVVTSDGRSKVRLRVPIWHGARTAKSTGPGRAEVDGHGITFFVREGRSVFVIAPGPRPRSSSLLDRGLSTSVPPGRPPG